MPEPRFPTLQKALEHLFPHQPQGRRVIIIDWNADRDLATEWAASLAEEMSDPAAGMELDAESLVSLFLAARRLRGEDAQRLVACLRRFILARWLEIAPKFSREVVRSWFPDDLLDALPEICSDGSLVREFAEYLAYDQYLLSDGFMDRRLRVISIEEARLLLAAAMKRSQSEKRCELTVRLFRMFGTSLGWTAWVQLFTVLFARPGYADPLRTISVDTDPQKRSREEIAADLEVHNVLADAREIRRVAGRLLELDHNGTSGGIFGAHPGDNRTMYVRRLIADIGDNDELRRAAVEWLLWVPEFRSADLAQFAAAHLLKAGDEAFLGSLENHPVSMVGYGGAVIGRDRLGIYPEAPELPVAPPSVLASLKSLLPATGETGEAPRTWIGDRMAERLIEQTISDVETRMGNEYQDHAGEGEESLLTLAFSRIADRFDLLDSVFASMAGLASGGRRIAIRYRRIDKHEEGKEGVGGAARFSTDLCFVVDPVLMGKPLGKRAALIQAKRLYGRPAPRGLEWAPTFGLDIAQIDELIEQTEASFLLFQGPLLAGRGLPVLPARLGRDLAAARGGAGTRISREMVAVASRSLADWLTYDLLALRIGDPWDELVTKAEGSGDKKSRRMLEAPRFEIGIEVTAGEAED